MEGHLGCDCTRKNKSKTYYEKLLKQYGRCFDNIYQDGISKSFKVEWVCKDGHKNHTLLHDLLNYAVDGGCNSCRSKESKLFGFYPNLLTRRDNLYLCTIFSDVEVFVKIGRSFNPKQRFTKLKYALPSNYGVHMEILDVGDHGRIFRKETELKSTLKAYKLVPSIKFGGYTECYEWEVLDKVIEE
jgi:hypothetical protein